MALETGTYVNDLVSTNPPGGDRKSQGDDHLRLIKAVLRATFPRAAKAFRFPQNLSKTVNYIVAAVDDSSTITVDTSAGAVTLTLPTLASSDDGWHVDVVKSNTGANPVYIVPPSGTLNGFAKVRRTMEFLITRVVWNGSVFIASRPNGGCIGEIRAFYGATLPNDCVWPSGETFSAANYVELNSVLGGNTTPDMRGRVGACRDNVGGAGAAGRIGVALVTDSATINGQTLGSSGGSSTHIQTAAEMPTHTHAITDTHTHGYSRAGTDGQNFGPGGLGALDTSTTVQTSTVSGGGAGSIVNQNTGSSSAMALLQPTLILNYGVVAE